MREVSKYSSRYFLSSNSGWESAISKLQNPFRALRSSVPVRFQMDLGLMVKGRGLVKMFSRTEEPLSQMNLL